jgi:hypothetical protein
MKTFSIKEAFRAGWDKWKQHKKVLTLATLIVILLEIFSDSRTHGFSIIAFVIFVVSFVIEMGWFKMLLRATHGEEPRVKDLIDHAHLIWKYLGVTILTFLIVLVGLILLIIPGIYFGLKYLFAPFIIIDRDITIMESLRESARMTEGVKWKLLGFCILVGLAGMSGVIALGVGLLVTVPVSTLAFLFVYKKLSIESSSSGSVPVSEIAA